MTNLYLPDNRVSWPPAWAQTRVNAVIEDLVGSAGAPDGHLEVVVGAGRSDGHHELRLFFASKPPGQSYGQKTNLGPG